MSKKSRKLAPLPETLKGTDLERLLAEGPPPQRFTITMDHVTDLGRNETVGFAIQLPREAVRQIIPAMQGWLARMDAGEGDDAEDGTS